MWRCLPTLLCCFLSCDARWMEQPYDDDSFNTKAEYLENATLTCEHDLDIIPKEYEVKYWVRPDMVHMGPNEEETFLTIDGTAGWKVIVHI